MTPRYNNAAGRLYELFKALQKIKDSTPMMEAWWEVLGLNGKIAVGTTPVQRLYLGHHLSIIARQLDQVEREAKEAFKDHPDIYATQFGTLREVLSPTNYDQNIGTYKQWLTPAALQDVAHCAKDLPKEKELISQDETTGLYGDIAQLKRAIHESKLDQRLKEWLTELADEMLKALDEYELCGGKSFERAWSYLVGNMVLRHADFLQAKQQAPEVVQKALSVTDKLNEFARRSALHAFAAFALGAAAAGAIEHSGARAVDTFIDAVAHLSTQSMADQQPMSGEEHQAPSEE
jgi:hypothetical protein